MTFDAPSREFCTVRRVRTNTPLQALTLLNDPASFEAARALADRMVAETPATATPRERAAFGVRLVLSRTATDQEIARLVSLMKPSARTTPGPQATPPASPATAAPTWRRGPSSRTSC